MDNKKKETKNIGLDVKAPEKTCTDKNCPFHGNLKVHGRVFTGLVVSSKAQKMVTARIKRLTYYSKYERYGKNSTTIHAHNPPCIDAEKGDVVKMMETKPLSKMKSFVVIEKTGHDVVEEKDYTAVAKEKKESAAEKQEE
jgi:small subunit ribosomal protein S17